MNEEMREQTVAVFIDENATSNQADTLTIEEQSALIGWFTPIS